MAIKFPLANGVWSNAANWNDGTLPQEGDDVHADGKTITIDVATVSVASIRTDLRTGGINGGGFNLGSGIPIFNITSNIFVGTGISNLITINIGVSCTLNLIGNIFGAPISGLGSRGIGLSSSDITLNITGNITPGTGQQTHGVFWVLNLANININFTGNISHLGGGIQQVSLGHGSAQSITNSNINIVGNVEGITNSVNAPTPIFFRFNTNNTFNMIGSVTHINGNGASMYLFLSDNNNQITLDECSVLNASTGNAVILNVNTSVLNPGGSINVKKQVHPAETFKSIISIADSRCTYITEELILPSSLKLSNNNFYVQVTDTLDNTLFLTQNSDITPRLPIISDVRQGISYNDGNKLGTLAVPDPSNVRKDIPTDNTVGTADLTAEDFWSYATRSLNTEVTASLNNTQTEVLNNIQIQVGNIEPKVSEIHQIHGLDDTNPLTVTTTQRVVGDIEQSIQTTGQDSTQETTIIRL